MLKFDCLFRACNGTLRFLHVRIVYHHQCMLYMSIDRILIVDYAIYALQLLRPDEY